MAGTAAGLSRVTIVSPRSRMDVALPSDIPLAELLPTVLRYAGPGAVEESAASGGWVLSRLDGKPMDTTRSAGQLKVRDGEVLMLGGRDAAAGHLVFDDVVDAVATATQVRTGRWRAADTRRFAFTLGALALVAGLLVTLLSGPPQITGAVVGLSGAVVLLLLAAITSRALGDSRAGALVGVIALGYAWTGGLLLLGGDHPLAELGAPHMLVAATALLSTAVVATIAVADGGSLFVGAAVGAVALALAAVTCQVFDVSAAGAAAVVVCAAFATLPVLPMISYRMGRLPVPSLPSSAEHIRGDKEKVNTAAVLAGADRAHAFLTGAMTTVSVIGAVAAAVLALTGGMVGLAMAVVLALVLLLRARSLINRQHRLPVLVSGTVSIAAVGAGAFIASGPVVRLAVVLGGVLLIAVISIGYGMFGVGGRPSPVAGRALDILEGLLIVAIVPLAAWMCGLYAWIRAIQS